MIKQRMSCLLYALEELRRHLTAFREPVTIERALPVCAAVVELGEALGRKLRSVIGSTAGPRTREA